MAELERRGGIWRERVLNMHVPVLLGLSILNLYNELKFKIFLNYKKVLFFQDGVLQVDSTKLRLHYMNSTTFYVDCLCLLPLDFLYLSLGFKSILRIFRLVKVYQVLNSKSKTSSAINVLVGKTFTPSTK